MNQSTNKLPLFLSQKEIGLLLHNINKDKHSLGLSLMSFGGLRVSEMCNLKINDIHLARGFMKVNGKGGKERIVPINTRLQKSIEGYLQKHGHKLSSDSFIVGGDRRTWHYVVKKYSSQNLGRNDVHCHTLRHSFATSMYENGIPVERISELLGHASIDTTMIYSHISISQKKDAVNSLDDSRFRFFRFLNSFKKKADISLKDYDDLIGRDNELSEINNYIKNGVSVVLFGPKGCGKTAILKHINNSFFIDEFKKKKTLIKIILSSRNIDDDIVYNEVEKELKKLSIDELLSEIKEFNKVIIIDDVSELSKPDRKTISKLSEITVVLASTSRSADRKLFKTYFEIKPLKRRYARLILSEMIHMNNPQKKERIINDILHQAGDSIKEAEYIANQLQLGKSTEEITSEERESNQVSIAPVLLIFVLFFVAFVLKSYATSMVAFSYALLVCFRLIFFKFIFMPANQKKKA